MLTLPAGFGLKESSTGGDPISVDLIGTAESEAELLADGYALEQGLKARQLGPEFMRVANPGVSGAPSETNQSMFRCTVGSAFYKPYDCNPGEPGAVSSPAIANQVHPAEVTVTPPPVQTAPETTTTTPAPESTPTPTTRPRPRRRSRRRRHRRW